MRLKPIGGAALALAAVLCAGPAGAVAASCQAAGRQHPLLENPPAQSCTDSGAGNVGDDDDFSHLKLYAGKGRTQLPQPAMLLIAGLGLLSLGLARGKRRRKGQIGR